jgi:hypothetical protein
MKKLILIIMFVGLLFAEPITKDINPTQLAGQEAVQVTVKFITVDSEGTEIFVTDALKYNAETETYEVYYTDIAFTIEDLPCELTEEEIEQLR